MKSFRILQPFPSWPSPNRRSITAKVFTVIKKGIGYGCVLAIVISWTAHHSIFWAIVHGFFSWLYVMYYAIMR